jgi:hypothetical protein
MWVRIWQNITCFPVVKYIFRHSPKWNQDEAKIYQIFNKETGIQDSVRYLLKMSWTQITCVNFTCWWLIKYTLVPRPINIKCNRSEIQKTRQVASQKQNDMASYWLYLPRNIHVRSLAKVLTYIYVQRKLLQKITGKRHQHVNVWQIKSHCWQIRKKQSRLNWTIHIH